MKPDIHLPFKNIQKYIPENQTVIQPSVHSHEGLEVPNIIMRYGKVKNPLKTRSKIINKMIFTIYHLWISYHRLKKNPEKAKVKIEEDQLKKLAGYAHNLGCYQIGFTKVPEKYIFKNKVICFPYAIVITKAMDKNKMKQAPMEAAGKEVWKTYADLGKIVNKLAHYMRKMGFNAQAGPALGGEVNYPLLAQKAGLGYIGQHGLLITEKYGPSIRIATVYTDIMNLPITDQDSEQHQWIREFCKKCGRCVQKCPGNAIFSTAKILEDQSEKHIDYTRCAVPFANYLGCSICIKECVFFNKGYQSIKERFLKKQE
ncbi:MAG: 4Fe-4S binding protein [Spirochaetes bacterium]|nr:4Fe-4S binding protein [Spirochaetota bacterium]